MAGQELELVEDGRKAGKSGSRMRGRQEDAWWLPLVSLGCMCRALPQVGRTGRTVMRPRTSWRQRPAVLLSGAPM